MDKPIHLYLSQFPEAALREFTEWCIFEQASAISYPFKPDQDKLNDLQPTEYLQELVGQFMEQGSDSYDASMAALFAAKLADTHDLTGSALLADLVSLYVVYLTAGSSKDNQQAAEQMAQASEQQRNKLAQIAKKYRIDI